MPLHAIQVEISPGDLIDRLTILEIKAARIRERAKRQQVRDELRRLREIHDAAFGPGTSPDLARLATELRAINESLWEVEDQLRVCERGRDFGDRFVQLARSVYRQNDRRAALKNQINRLLGSPLREEKSYPAWEDRPGSGPDEGDGASTRPACSG